MAMRQKLYCTGEGNVGLYSCQSGEGRDALLGGDACDEETSPVA